MARDLGPLRELLQIREREFERIDEPINAQAPISEIVFAHGRIFLALGHACAIDLENR
jgi:hypothetical protein